MKENKYDEAAFFEKYSQMPRSKQGLSGAGEWESLQKILPDFLGKSVLDLGCGYGWHCTYAAEQGASRVVGIDLSEKMLETARSRTESAAVEYRRQAIEDADFPPESFDIVLCSLALHYVESYPDVVRNVRRMLKPGGIFLFNVEHPVFTAAGPQDWCYTEDGKIQHFPVDHYFEEGKRTAVFLEEPVVKYHRTLTSYVGELLQNGFILEHLVEPAPPAHMIDIPGMRDELRRPMMLILSARKA